MNRFFVLLFSFICINAYAQDVITTMQGEEIKAKVVKVGITEIEYKRWSNLEGPSYVLPKNQTFMIKYQNGEKDVFGSKKSEQIDADNVYRESVSVIPQKRTIDNDRLIKEHNKIPAFVSFKKSKKNAKKFFPVMAISEKSIISTEDIEMKFVPQCVEDYDFNNRYRIKYYIRLKNKTSKIIYIDKAQCFRKDNNEASTSFFDSKQISISMGNQGGLGIGTAINNTMNIGIGGGVSNMQTSTYSQQRFIFIPPYSEVNLTEYVYDEIRKVKTLFTQNHKIIFDIETWNFNLSEWNGILHKDEILECDEVNSPHKTEYHIIYSMNKDFTTYSVLNAKLYAKYLVGRDYNTWTEIFTFDRIRKIIQNFIGAEGEIDIIVGQPNKVKN